MINCDKDIKIIEKIFYKLGILAIIGLGIIMMIFTRETFFYPTMLEVNSFEVVEDSIKRGDMLTYRLDICKYADKTVQIHRTLLNDVVINLPSIQANLPMGCQTIVRKVTVPGYAPSGKYILRSTVDFRINSFKTVSYAHETGLFQITE